MAIKTKQNDSLKRIEQEVSALRSFVIGLAGKDPEGNYRPEFVGKALKLSQEDIVGEFKDSQSFLNKVNGN
jgi:hypothetical protein